MPNINVIILSSNQTVNELNKNEIVISQTYAVTLRAAPPHAATTRCVPFSGLKRPKGSLVIESEEKKTPRTHLKSPPS